MQPRSSRARAPNQTTTTTSITRRRQAMKLSPSDIHRFHSRYAKTTGCWIWQGPLDCGYGRFWAQGKTLLSHRVAWEIAKNRKVPNGLQLDHLCRNRDCVNPDHLEPVTLAQNVLRGQGITAQNLLKTACPEGHPYSGENLYQDKTGRRHCRTCSVNRTRAWRAIQKGQSAA